MRIARVLFITDFHKRYSDSTSIRNQVAVQNKIQYEIIDFVKANDITHIVITGDWYDRGFHSLGQAYGSIEMDRKLSEAVNGRVYICVGNHFYLERDENPEMYIIQPNDFLRPSIDIPLPEKPIFQMVQQLNIGTVQIDFFHYNKLNKEYISHRNPSVKFHVGVYHDEAVVPGWVRETEGFSGSSSQSYMNRIYDNIDLAVHGHIHTAIGMCSMVLDNGRKVPLCIPGALCVTQNKEVFKHKEVSLPIIDIHDDDKVELKAVKFSLHLDELEFHTPKKKQKQQSKNISDGSGGQLQINTSYTELQSLYSYLNAKGYDDVYTKLVSSALSDTLNLATAVRILVEVDNENAGI